MCRCEMTRGDYINRRATTGSRIVSLRETILKLEKVAAAKDALALARDQLSQLEKDYAMWSHLEHSTPPEGNDVHPR